ncbi:hypothetical protein [Holdemania massiliensis]|uniref:hypothetical protein n=1 Tax=Holdemania massiliensis TaxID=1468449 RepID=UPI001F057608|nr:hypothetical protein [Holdemania massiliensis]MCH1939159.1 hypothetical protein [Holdemania massiliensis]
MKRNDYALVLLGLGFIGLLIIHITYIILVATTSYFLYWHSYMWDHEMISVYVLSWLFVILGGVQLFLEWKNRKTAEKSGKK